MNEKNKSASNAAQNTNMKSAGPDVNTDSDLEIQELLRKYLPEFAESEEETAVPAVSQNKKAQKAAPTEIVSEDDEEVIDEDYLDEEPPKKQGFFARLRSSRKKEEPAAPDSEIFDQISSAQEEPAENDDADVKFAEEISEEETPRGEIDPELLMALGLDVPGAEKIESETPAETEEDTADPDELSPEEVDDTEQNLFVGWGMEDQLDKKAGVGTADKVAARNDAEAKEYEAQQRRVVEYEYTERSQTPKIAA